VRHTFLEFVQATEHLAQENEVACMRRTCSDSALCLQAGACDLESDQECGSEDEVVLLDSSDDDCDGEGEGADVPEQSASACCAQALHSSSVSTSTGARSRPSSVGSGQQSTPPEGAVAGAAMTADMLRQKLEEMASENARLSRENVVLRKRVVPDALEAPPAADQAAGVCQGFPGALPAAYDGGAFSQEGGFAQVPHGSWWLPVGVSMTPVACFPMATEVAQQPAPRAEEQPWRGRKAKLSRSAREMGPVQRTGVILPNPTKPQTGPPLRGPQTTVMIRNMPNNYSRAMFVELLDSEGFAGQYDFLYLPMDFESHACLGYAFVDCTSPAVAARLWSTFDGYSTWAIPSRKASGVSWSAPLQGFRAHVERYRNSPVMAKDVPDEFKPVIFENGIRVPFPSATHPLRHMAGTTRSVREPSAASGSRDGAG